MKARGHAWLAWTRLAGRLARYSWAAPTSLFGLLAGALTLATGGRVQCRRGALEFHGGFARWLLARRWVGASAMTLGHVILGRDVDCLDFCRDHEQIHVRQVERWGILFLPAYGAASLWALARGRHYYWDNAFEVDARVRCGEECPPAPVRARRPSGFTRVDSMPTTAHVEKHFTGSAWVRDVVIGMSDGLTVPFALAAGLSGNAAITTSVIVTAGLAEVAAGSIAMGLGGYLAGKGDREHYDSERARELREIRELPEAERREVVEILRAYGLTEEQARPILDHFAAHPDAWIDFMMRFELGLERPDANRALASALTIALAYVAGGLIPLVPYMIVDSNRAALGVSVAVTLAALFLFGFGKGRFTGMSPARSAGQTTLIGGLAAAAAFSIARMFS